ncbi:MAG: pyridoxal phosphate-dependent aminotransferase [Saprospiraceae bacterium]
MSVRRLSNIPGFSIDQVAKAAGSNPGILRLENLDTDLLPPKKAVEATRDAIGEDEHNSYLPFIGQDALRQMVAQKLSAQTRQPYSPGQVVITCGGTEGMFDALLALTDPGDEVILTDPTYAGMINRVRLAGAIPVLVPFVPVANEWRLDMEALQLAISPRTKVLFLMNPSMPSGAMLTMQEWQVIARLCFEQDLWLLYNAAMENILFDNRQLIHPAAIEGMSKRTVVVGSASKELRMIGWRTGWVVAPKTVADDIARVHIFNAVTPTGIAQAGVAEALQAPAEDFEKCRSEWERRRDVVVEQLDGYSMIPAAGGWSQLLDVTPFEMDAAEASRLLLKKGKTAVTPMTHWGQKNSSQFIRIVFSNEPVERLSTLGQRFKAAFG